MILEQDNHLKVGEEGGGGDGMVRIEGREGSSQDEQGRQGEVTLVWGRWAEEEEVRRGKQTGRHRDSVDE